MTREERSVERMATVVWCSHGEDDMPAARDW